MYAYILYFSHRLLFGHSFSSSETLVKGVIWDKDTKVGGELPGPLGQLCCKFNANDLGIKNERVEVSIPHPLNHSSTILLGCDTFLKNANSPGYCKNCKEYTSCSYCNCLYQSGD